MKKLILGLAALVSLSAFAATNSVATQPIQATLEVGYGTTYIVNGIARSKEAPVVGFGLLKDYGLLDVSISGTLLPTTKGLESSHWQAGLGHTFDFNKDKTVGLRFEADAYRHETSAVGFANSTEVAGRVAFKNPILTPYVSYSYDLDIKQKGFIVGALHNFNVFNLFVLTPSVEYGKFSSYDVFDAKLEVSRVLFNHLEVFGGGAFYDNSFDKVFVNNFSVKKLKSEFVWNGGLRWRF